MQTYAKKRTVSVTTSAKKKFSKKIKLRKESLRTTADAEISDFVLRSTPEHLMSGAPRRPSRARTSTVTAQDPNSLQKDPTSKVAAELSASPVLRGKKRRTSQEASDQPSPKRMATNEILAAINGVKRSVESMDKRLKNFCTKNDLRVLSDEVSEGLQSNSSRISQLYDLRKSDAENLVQTVAKIVDDKLATCGKSSGSNSLMPLEEEQERNYSVARRSVRLWPVTESSDEEKEVRAFLRKTLDMPVQVVDGLQIEKIARQQQPRRSRIHSEVLVRLTSHLSRDVIQSYAANLASSNGNAGIRLEIPEHLVGLFKRFEAHAAALREAHGQVKRSIRFDDTCRSLCMDVKLLNTGWHRIDKECLAQITKNRPLSTPGPSTSNDQRRDERRLIMMLDTPSSSGPGSGVQSEDEDDRPRRSARNSGRQE